VRRVQNEPLQEGTRRIVVKAPAELPVLVMGYKAPVLRDIDHDSDPYALEMLSAVLDGHDAARFNKNLVREAKVALSVGIDYDTTARGPGMIYLSGSPAEGKTVSELEAALRAEIERVQREGVSEQELKRAKAQLLASQVYKLDSMFGQAMEIGQIEAVGLSYKKLDRMLEKLQQVSAADVQAVAKKYFIDDALTVGVLEPQALDGKPRRAAVATRH
jgi:zinc protease